MKTKLILLSLVTFFAAYAQPKVDCQALFSDFEHYYKVDFSSTKLFTTEQSTKAIDKIQEMVQKCPAQNQELYKISEEMLLRLIKPLNVGEAKQNLSNMLVDLYTTHSKHFPETNKQNSLKKIELRYTSGISNEEESLKAFDQFYASDKEVFTADALNIYAYLMLSQNQTNSSVSTEYIKKLDAISLGITSKIQELESKKSALTVADVNLKKLDTDINSLKISSKNIITDLKNKKLDCNLWNELYKEDFEKNKKDIIWLENALFRLEDHRCTSNNELFQEMAEEYYDLKKSVKSAYFMGSIALAKRDKVNSIKYFNESAELEPNQTEKAKLYYRLADLNRNTDKAQAKKFIDKSIENNPDSVESYILLANLYANADASCFKNDFEKKALFLLASQTIKRAIEANPKFEVSAQKLNKSFLDKAPTKEEIKKSGMQGKTIDFGCWINQSIVVP